MFRHKNTVDQTTENKKTPEILPVDLENKPVEKTESETIKALLEKNLKWSQIIYEQNRKINSKLMWTAIASWLRTLLIVVPIILALWFLPSLFKSLQNTYGSLLGGQTTPIQSNSIDQLLKVLPLDPAKQEQLKVLLK